MPHGSIREWLVLAEDGSAVTLGGFRVEIVDELSDDELKNVRDVLEEITGLLRQHGFPRLAGGNVRVLNTSHTNGVIAEYDDRSDTILLMRPDYRDADAVAHTVAHELGHRFHDLCREVPRAVGEIDHALFTKYRECMQNFSLPDQTTNRYSASNHFEFWAVCFQQLLFGELREDLADWAEDILRTFYPRMR